MGCSEFGCNSSSDLQIGACEALLELKYLGCPSPGVPNLLSKVATSTQCNIFGGRSQQFKLKRCTVSPVVFH